MTVTVFDSATNTITTDPEQVARHVVVPGREGTSDQDPPRIIIAADIDDDETQEHWLWLHPAQALAVGKRLIDLANAANDPRRAATTFPVIADADRSHLARAHEDAE
ncbi:hypothetical protein AB1K56_02705 [Microbacterium sp. BWR-S6Y]|uniref:hypothetical protein n=1 Tax=Microbacterium sp. BWR-S6Y TaxID=3232073 RepID=UPI0035275F6E